jgi:hypothetical protein
MDQEEKDMQTNNLSTATMIKVVQFSEDWAEQCAMLDVLKHRRDLFNLDPVLRLAVSQAQPFSVRRAATECAATHNESFALKWISDRAENRFLPAHERILALEALAALHRPNETLPVLEQIASNSAGREAKQARVEALRLIGKYRNLRSVGLLTELERDRDRVIAAAAQAALDNLIEGHRGRRIVTQKMLQRADLLEKQGNRHAAREVLRVASRLEPNNGKLLYRIARLAAA